MHFPQLALLHGVPNTGNPKFTCNISIMKLANVIEYSYNYSYSIHMYTIRHLL